MNQAWRLLGILAILWLPALFGRSVILTVASQYALAENPSAYFVPGHFNLLYVTAPVVVASATVLFISPGLFLALALRVGHSVARWVLYGIGLSIFLTSLVAGVVQTLLGQPLIEVQFATVVVVLSIFCFVILLARLSRGTVVAWPVASKTEYLTLLSVVVVPLLLLIALTPKFYWESFNGDGAHAFESARLLLHQPFPFWPPTAGEAAGCPGATTMAYLYPVSWFVRLFGEVEAAARLPFLLYLVALYSGLIAAISHRRFAPLGIIERWLLWLALVIFSMAMAYSATYSPYMADIALPATEDALQIATFLGFTLAFLRREIGWLALFAGLTFTNSPNGLMLMGLWLVAGVLIVRPVPWKWVAVTAMVILGIMILSVATPSLLLLLDQPAPGREHGIVGLMKRFAFLQFTDWRRFLYLLVPSGILPALSLLAWRWQDRISRMFTVVTVLYFAVFYIQAHIMLHHFAPIMVLPLVVFWRSIPEKIKVGRPALLAATAVAGVLALVLSFPSDFTVHSNARRVGMALESRIPGYEAMAPCAFGSVSILSNLFPYTWDPSVPETDYGGSPLTWNYYAHHRDSVPVNYVLQSAAEPPPADMRLVTSQEQLALFVADEEVWSEHRAFRPAEPVGSPVYFVKRGILYRSVPLQGGPYIVNVVDLLDGAGVDMDPILERMGVSR